MAKIFISYRREDSEHVTGRIFDHLEARFGRDNVFLDIDTIPFGADFRRHVGQAVGQCGALLAVIGEQWLDVRYREGPKQGQRRLDDPADFVRIEIESALARGIPVVPVLVGQATMPRAEDLPEGLKELAYRNAAEVRAGRDFRGQVERLIRSLEFPAPAVRAAAESSGQTLDDIKRHFVEQVKLRAAESYIDRKGEREILCWAVEQGIIQDSARAALGQVCEQQGYVLESRVVAAVKELLEQFGGKDGRIEQKQFQHAVALCRRKLQGKKTEFQAKKMVVQVIEDNGYRPRQGCFSGWYNAAKKEVGV
jgi:hypothetical protein